MGATPQKLQDGFTCKVQKGHLKQELINVFYVNTWILLYSFKFQGGRGYSPPSPSPKSATVAIDEIKIFDNDDKATKLSERKECFAAFSSL